jgi:hypothetical protein
MGFCGQIDIGELSEIAKWICIYRNITHAWDVDSFQYDQCNAWDHYDWLVTTCPCLPVPAEAKTGSIDLPLNQSAIGV